MPSLDNVEEGSLENLDTVEESVVNVNVNAGQPGFSKNGVKIGRPTKFSPERIELLRSKLAMGAPIMASCESSGIKYETYKKWMENGRKAIDDAELRKRKIAAKDEDYVNFFRVMTVALAEPMIMYIGIVSDAATGKMPDISAVKQVEYAQWMLERGYPQQFAKGVREMHGAEGSTPSVLSVLDSLGAEAAKFPGLSKFLGKGTEEVVTED